MLLNKVNDVGFEVLTLMIMKSTILCDVMPCSKVEIHQSSSEMVKFYQSGITTQK
jgi:hypothetical protein